MLGAVVALPADPGGEGIRAHGTAAAIKQYNDGRGSRLAPDHPIEHCFLGAKSFSLTVCKRGTAIEIDLGKSIKSPLWSRWGTRPGADLDQSEVHGEEDTANVRQAQAKAGTKLQLKWDKECHFWNMG
jgi:hypothetical protein